MKRLPLVLACVLAACAATRPEIPVSKTSVDPGSAITVRGKRHALAPGSLKVGDDLRAKLKDAGVDLELPAGPALINIVPSIDTRVCEAQTHILGESRALKPGVARVVISRDLPMAQKRFAREAKLENVVYLSDFKEAAFGKATGLLIPDSGLLTRGVIVIDAAGVVRHQQFVAELTFLPDMDAAIAAANALAR